MQCDLLLEWLHARHSPLTRTNFPSRNVCPTLFGDLILIMSSDALESYARAPPNEYRAGTLEAVRHGLDLGSNGGNSKLVSSAIVVLQVKASRIHSALILKQLFPKRSSLVVLIFHKIMILFTRNSSATTVSTRERQRRTRTNGCPAK